MGLRRVWARAAAVPWRRRVAALAAALALAACARAPARLESRAAFPRAHAAALAHLLADYSTHPHAGSWSVLEERGNYSQWRYRVAFECGPRCEGEAAVHAAAEGAGTPRHGRAPRHLVRLELRACSRPPLLPWPTFCDETEIEWTVSPESAGGCAVREVARAWCAVPRVLSGACARELRRRSDRHRASLRAELDRAA